MALPTKEEIFDALRPISDPEIRIGIVDLGASLAEVVGRDAYFKGPHGQVRLHFTLSEALDGDGAVFFVEAFDGPAKQD